MDEYEFESSCMCTCTYLKCFTEQSCTMVIAEYIVHVACRKQKCRQRISMKFSTL